MIWIEFKINWPSKLFRESLRHCKIDQRSKVCLKMISLLNQHIITQIKQAMLTILVIFLGRDIIRNKKLSVCKIETICRLQRHNEWETLVLNIKLIDRNKILVEESKLQVHKIELRIEFDFSQTFPMQLLTNLNLNWILNKKDSFKWFEKWTYFFIPS